MTVYEIQKRLHVTQLQKNQVETAVLDALMMLEKAYNRVFVVPEIRYDLVGRSAGQAVWDPYGKVKHFIRINPVLLNENGEDMVNQTVPHEVAHVVVTQLYEEKGHRVQGHGYEWQSVMRQLGLKPDRCHSYDVTSIRAIRGGKEYHFTCMCVGFVHKFSKSKYTRYINGNRYVCRRCRGSLKFDKAVDLV